MFWPVLLLGASAWVFLWVLECYIRRTMADIEKRALEDIKIPPPPIRRQRPRVLIYLGRRLRVREGWLQFGNCRRSVARSGRVYYNMGGWVKRHELRALMAMGIRYYDANTGELVGGGKAAKW